jgi:hypothetical protein
VWSSTTPILADRGRLLSLERVRDFEITLSPVEKGEVGPHDIRTRVNRRVPLIARQHAKARDIARSCRFGIRNAFLRPVHLHGLLTEHVCILAPYRSMHSKADDDRLELRSVLYDI